MNINCRDKFSLFACIQGNDQRRDKCLGAWTELRWQLPIINESKTKLLWGLSSWNADAYRMMKQPVERSQRLQTKEKFSVRNDSQSQ